MFSELERTGADLDIRSTLATETALEALALFEAATKAGQDAVLASSGTIADGFISYIWFVADALEELAGQATVDAVHDAVRATLAWQQLHEDARNQLIRAADIAFAAFLSQPGERRRRWARAGISIPSSVALDALADEVLEAWLAQPAIGGLNESLRLILANGRIDTILGLAENDRRGFKARRNAPRNEFLAVDLNGLVNDWLSGAELQELADKYLAEIGDRDYCYNQLAEFVASVFEHHLPWTLGIVIDWVNRKLDDLDQEQRLPAELPGVVHFGVSTAHGLELMLGRVRSRRLANTVARAFVASNGPNDGVSLRGWLTDQDIAAWRQRFEASPTELLDLLEYGRAPEARLVSEVLEGNSVKLPISTREDVPDHAEAHIDPEPGQPDPAPLAVIVAGSIIGRIAPEHHQDVALLTSIGIPLSVHIERAADGQVHLDLRLEPEPQ